LLGVLPPGIEPGSKV